MRRTASEVIRNLEARVARLERQSVRKSYTLDQDEKKIVQALKRKLRKVGVENLYPMLLVALHDANFHSEAKAISSALNVSSDWTHPTVYDAGIVMASKCKWDGGCIARVFAEAGKKDTALIDALTNQNLL